MWVETKWGEKQVMRSAKVLHQTIHEPLSTTFHDIRIVLDVKHQVSRSALIC